MDAPIDLNKAIGMAKAAQQMRGKGGRLGVAVDTARRWANPLKGCDLGGGHVAVLRTVRWCGELLTLPEWVEDFERERASRLVVVASCVANRRPERTRRAAHRRAVAELERMGVK